MRFATLTLLCMICAAAYSQDKPIIIKPNTHTFLISLKSNPGSTGFSWRLSHYNDKFITPKSWSFQPSNFSMPGAPGEEHFEFIVNQKAFKFKQLTQVEFVYIRPWSMEISKTEKIFIISE